MQTNTYVLLDAEKAVAKRALRHLFSETVATSFYTSLYPDDISEPLFADDQDLLLEQDDLRFLHFFSQILLLLLLLHWL